MQLLRAALFLIAAAAGCGSKPALPCAQSADCAAGLVCNTNTKLCYPNCGDVSNQPADLFCQIGWRCQPDLTCVQPTSCDPKRGATDCNGPICDAATKKCGAAKSCTVDGDCSDLYACDTFKTKVCNRSCSDSLACKQGKVCNTALNVCN